MGIQRVSKLSVISAIFILAFVFGAAGTAIDKAEAGANAKYKGHSFCARVMNRFVNRGKVQGRGKGYHAIAYTANGSNVQGCGGPDKGTKTAAEARRIAISECKKHSGGRCNKMLGPILKE